MKKKFLGILLVLSMLFQVAVFAENDGIASDEQKNNAPIVEIDGKKVVFEDQQPVILEAEGRTMVPARGVFEEMKATVEWNEEKRLVTICSSNNVIRILITIDNPVMTVYRFTSIFSANKDEIQLDAAPRIMNNRTMIPLRAISEALNATVDWNGETRTVSIFTKEQHGFYTPRPVQSGEPSSTFNPFATQNPSATSSPQTTPKPGSTADPSSDQDSYTQSGTNSDLNTSGEFNPDNVEVYITSDKTLANAGDIITINVNVKGIQGKFGSDEGIIGVTAGLEYDTSVLEYVENSIKYNTTATGITSVVNPKMDSNGVIVLKSFGGIIDLSKAMKNDGMVVQMQFKVLSKTSTTVLLSNRYNSGIGYDTSLDYMINGKRRAIKKNLRVDKTPIKIN